MRIQKMVTLASIVMLVSAALVSFACAEIPLPQNDAGIPGDAGGDFVSSRAVNGSTNYTGTLDPYFVEWDDYYNFTAIGGHWINITMTPPPDADFDLYLYNTSQQYVANSTTRADGATEKIDFPANFGGTWYLQVRAIDNTDRGNYTFVIIVNLEPATPPPPSGPTTGYVYTDYTYSDKTTDPENDRLSYRFWWGDGSNTTLNALLPDATANATHQWKRPIAYNITVQAKDGFANWTAQSNLTTVNLDQYDGGKPGDAGNEISSARDLPTNSYIGQPYSLKGTLYYTNPTDPDDYYNFTVVTEDHIHATMTPPSNADFDLYLYHPNGSQAANSTTPTAGQTEAIDFNAGIGGNWTLRVSRATAEEGQYNFTVQVGWKLTVNKSGCPLIINIWIDGQAYCSFPATVWVHAGSHTLRAQAQANQGTWPYWVYYFDHWSDGVTDNPRTLNITQDTTITAYYVRGGGPP